MPIGNIWLLPDAFKTVFVFAISTHCILLEIRTGNTFALAPVLSLQLICSPPIEMVSYHLFASLLHVCSATEPTYNAYKKSDRFCRCCFLTGPAWTGQVLVPFFSETTELAILAYACETV